MIYLTLTPGVRMCNIFSLSLNLVPCFTPPLIYIAYLGIGLIFIITEIPHNSKGDNVFFQCLSVLWGMWVIEKQSTELHWPCPFKPFIVHLVST